MSRQTILEILRNIHDEVNSLDSSQLLTGNSIIFGNYKIDFHDTNDGSIHVSIIIKPLNILEIVSRRGSSGNTLVELYWNNELEIKEELNLTFSFILRHYDGKVQFIRVLIEAIINNIR